MSGRDNNTDADALDAPPPILGSWRRVYTLVIVTEVVVVALLAMFGALAS